MIDVVALRTLVAVDRRGSVTAAAESLGYSPSALSQQIKKLERTHRCVLVEKSGRGVVLTAHGRFLAQRAQPLLDDLESLAVELDSRSGRATGTVRLAAFSTAMRGIVAPMMAALAAQEPQLSLDVCNREPEIALAEVASGQLDLAIVHDWDTRQLSIPEAVRVRPLGGDVVDVILDHKHPLAGAEPLTVEDLAEISWITTPPESICAVWLRQVLAGIDRVPRVAAVDPEYATHVSFVAAGLAGALLPRLGRATLPDGICVVPLAVPSPVRRLQLAWRSTMAGSLSVQRVADAAAEVYPGGSS